MKRRTLIGTALLSLSFLCAAALSAQQDQHGNKDQQKSSQSHQQTHQQTHQQAPARTPQTQPRPQQTYGGGYHGGVQPNGPTHGGVHHSGVPQQQSQVRTGFQQSRAGSWDKDHQSWTQRGGYNGYRIPQARFQQYFGAGHFFRISGLPLLFVGGQPRFQYDGYWITLVDPWPETWGADWYDTDDVYLDYNDDGYYLYDRNYPGVAIAVVVTF